MLLEFLRPPQLEDPEAGVRAAIAWFTILLGFGATVVQAILCFIVPTMWDSLVFVIPEWIGLLAALTAMRSGYVRLGSWLLMGMLVSQLTMYVFLAGGLESALPPMLGVGAVMGALVIGWRAGVALTIYSLLCTVAVFIFGSSDLLKVPGQDPTSVLFQIQFITVLLLGALVTFSAYRLSSTVASERRQTRLAEDAAERLDVARRYTEGLVQGLADALVVVDEHGVVQQVNDAAVLLFDRRQPEDLVGLRFDSLLRVDELNGRDRAPVPQRALFGETTLGNGPEPIRLRVGRSEILSETGQRLHAFVLSDVSVLAEARRRSAEAARAADEANEAKSQFLANMSHELRTPLNAVIGYSDMLLEGIDDEQQLEDLSRIRQAGHHLLSLINDILDMSKIEAGKMELVIHEVDLRTLFDEVCSSVAGSSPQFLSASIEVDGAVGVVQTDERLLKQILINLVTNALKFSDGAAVQVAVRCSDTQLVIAVIDHGIGIDGPTLANLFQPFVQADSSARRRHGGTGLGLALSRRFAEMLGGTIEARSEVGIGSEFRVLLPIPPAPTDLPIASDEPRRASL
ncbi:MAG: ATP-binding protein [Myxococcota bacterium]